MKRGNISIQAVTFCVFAFIFLLAGSFAHAAPTKQLSYQGRLNNAGGQPVPDGTYTIVFSIYNVATGGSALWTETQNVSVVNGGFSVYLGSVTPITLTFNEDYFLGIKVASDPEMTPRLKLSVVGASAYSLEAEKLQGKAASDFALASHTHTGLSATTVNGFSASATPTANTLLPLDSLSKFPASVLPALTDSEISASANISASKINTTGATNLVTQIVAGTNVTVSPAGGTGIVTVNATPATGFVQLTPSSAQTIQPTGDVVPLIIKDDTVGTTADLFDVQNNSGTSLVKVNPSGKLFIGNPATVTPKVSILDSGGGTAFYSEVSGATGYAGRFNNTNSSNPNEALNVSTNGTGPGIWVASTGTSRAAILEINNATNNSALLYGSIISGTGNLVQLLSGGATKFVVDNTGNTLVGNPTVTTAKVSVEETGTSNLGGYFKINNASNANAAVYGVTTGTGDAVKGWTTGTSAAVFGYTTGTGRAGYFQINNASNASPSVRADTIGTGTLFFGTTTGTGSLLQLQQGGVDKFVVDNAGNTLVGNPTVTTAKVSAYETGTANYAGYFSINNATNTNPAVFAGSSGSGDGIYAVSVTGRAGRFEINNATNTSPAVYGMNAGLGRAGWFWVNNASNSSEGIRVITDGTGFAGLFTINNASNTNAVILGQTIGTGNLLGLQTSGVNQFIVGNNGKITFSTGANKAVGTGTIAAATNSITIANTAVTASSLIFLTITNTTGSVAMPLKVGTITAGTSFVVDTGDATNAPAGGINFNYMIVN